ncbi:hypothetical protein MAP00_002567 [Monascus purpureus]|nr:hypothetical protein MAP00_002567 [Monascus purpureus]
MLQVNKYYNDERHYEIEKDTRKQGTPSNGVLRRNKRKDRDLEGCKSYRDSLCEEFVQGPRTSFWSDGFRGRGKETLTSVAARIADERTLGHCLDNRNRRTNTSKRKQAAGMMFKILIRKLW